MRLLSTHTFIDPAKMVTFANAKFIWSICSKIVRFSDTIILTYRRAGKGWCVGWRCGSGLAYGLFVRSLDTPRVSDKPLMGSLLWCRSFVPSSLRPFVLQLEGETALPILSTL